MDFHDLPAVNAGLNGLCTVLLTVAFVAIKRRRYAMHGWTMVLALCCSAAFLTCYIIYHTYKVRKGETFTVFPPGSWRPVYLGILISHTILAAIILPLIIMTTIRAAQRRWVSHRKLSVWTFPLWYYVSVTGVVIYFMLYHLAPTLKA